MTMTLAIHQVYPAPPKTSMWVTASLTPAIEAARVHAAPAIELRPVGELGGLCSPLRHDPDSRVCLSHRCTIGSAQSLVVVAARAQAVATMREKVFGRNVLVAGLSVLVLVMLTLLVGVARSWDQQPPLGHPLRGPAPIPGSRLRARCLRHWPLRSHPPGRLAAQVGVVTTPPPHGSPKAASACGRRQQPMSASRHARRGCASGAMPRDARGVRHPCSAVALGNHLSSRSPSVDCRSSLPACDTSCSPVRTRVARLRCGLCLPRLRRAKTPY